MQSFRTIVFVAAAVASVFITCAAQGGGPTGRCCYNDPCIGDNAGVNSTSPDGVVDTFDLLLMLSDWGSNGDSDIAGPNGPGEFDGVVDTFDLLALLADWGCVSVMCVEATEAECSTLPFNAWNPDATCDDPCGLTIGRCCYYDSETFCFNTWEWRCDSFGGVWDEALRCQTDPCPPQLGRCCFSAGPGTLCEDTDQPTCTNAFSGVWDAGLSCSNDPCPPLGSCCYDVGGDDACVFTSPEQCANVFGGTFILGVQCFSDPCTPTPIGRCCYLLTPGIVDCEDVTEETCLNTFGGQWDPALSCSGNFCPQPQVGRCCYDDGVNVFCANVDAVTCANGFGGTWDSGLDCATDPCPPLPLGRCCFAGVCTDSILESECDGQFDIWTEGALCVGASPCPPQNNVCDLSEFVLGDLASGVSIPFDLSGATTTGGPACGDFPFGDNQIHQDLWYAIPQSISGTLFVDTCGGETGAPIDTRLAVYFSATSSCDDLVLVECNDDHGNATEGDTGNSCSGAFEASLSVPVQPNGIYVIRVGTYQADTPTGPDVLNVQLQP